MTEAARPKTAKPDPAPQDSSQPEPTPKRGGRGRLLAIVLALVVIGGGAAAAFFTMRKPAHPGAAPVEKPVEHGLLSLEPFVVNLADSGSSRFLRVSIRLVVGSKEQAEHIQKDDVALVRLRSSLLELLTQQTADALVTAEGKAALKHAISARAESVLEDAKVSDVLFSDFVVQF